MGSEHKHKIERKSTDTYTHTDLHFLWSEAEIFGVFCIVTPNEFKDFFTLPESLLFHRGIEWYLINKNIP